MNTKDLAMKIATFASDKKANDILLLNMEGLSPVTDYFVICSASNNMLVKAIADNIEDRMIEKCRRKVARTQGKENAFWVILDYGDIVVHVFQTPYRAFYRLEDLWADAERTVYED